MNMKEQIADFLAQGFTQAETARFCGVTAPVVSDYMKEEGFKEVLRAAAIKHVNKRIQTKYDTLEEKTLDGLLNAIKEFADVGDMVRVLESIAKIKKSNVVPAHTYQNPTIGVMVVMPQRQIPEVIVDSNNQVIAIGERSLAAMPSANVQRLFKNLEQGVLIEQAAGA